jgi:hypothetical protein
MTQAELVKRAWEEWDVSEVAHSIVASGGFWPHQPLLVCRDKGKVTVLDGNRRVAAVKLLTSSECRRQTGVQGVPRAGGPLVASLQMLPAVFTTRRASWPFLGFHGIKQPQAWDSFSKARYIAHLRDEQRIPLRKIAARVGDRNSTVERLYETEKILEQAIHTGAFDPADRFFQRKDFAFIHLLVALTHENVRKFLGIAGGKRSEREPIPKSKVSALGELCRWIYGSHKEGTEPLIKSQNPHLRQLDEALRTQRGVSALRRGLPLQQALNASRGDTRLLLDALVAAEQNLRDAKAYFSTGYGGQQEIDESVNNVFVLAESLLDELKSTTQKK